MGPVKFSLLSLETRLALSTLNPALVGDGGVIVTDPDLPPVSPQTIEPTVDPEFNQVVYDPYYPPAPVDGGVILTDPDLPPVSPQTIEPTVDPEFNQTVYDPYSPYGY